MRPFVYNRAGDAKTLAALLAQPDSKGGPPTSAPAQILAGGTTLVDLMRLDVMRPERVVDITRLDGLSEIVERDGLIRLGALVKMEDAARHPALANYPVIVESLNLAASPQLRNMATLGGNVLQRTRCPYFRDVSWAACNKRDSGSGCAALDGFNRQHAVLGVSDQCIATYPGDFAQALIALDTTVETTRGEERRIIPFHDLHRAPGDQPDVETVLSPNEVIRALFVPATPWARRSKFVKVRDRESYEFALASAAIALDLAEGGQVREARIALGGVATKPWRAYEAERALIGQSLTDNLAREAAEIAFRDAHPRRDNAFKVELGKRTLVRALKETATMEV